MLEHKNRSVAKSSASSRLPQKKIRQYLCKKFTFISLHLPGIFRRLRSTSRAEKKQICLRIGKKLSWHLIYLLKYSCKPDLWRVYKVIKNSASFNENWYLSYYPDIAAKVIDPLLHYVVQGVREGRNPSPFFDTCYYLENYPDVTEANTNPLFHYVEQGINEGRNPSPLFDEHYYFNELTKIIYRTLDGSPLFDGKWYLLSYPDVAAAEVDPVRHYMETGADQGRNPSSHFETRFYVETYPDVAKAKVNPLYHYLTIGQAEGRQQKRFDHDASKEWVATLRADPAAGKVLKNNPLVSVIMPTKNRIRILPNAIESVLRQSYRNWELLIIDDDSRDGTATIISTRYKDPRIKLLKNSGCGVCDARNHGLFHASGEYVAYLDSDNVWMSEYLELMLFEIKRTGFECVYAILKCINVHMEHEPRNFFYRLNLFDYEKLKLHNFIDMNVFMHKRDLFEELGGFDPHLKRMVDWDLILRYTRNRATGLAYFVGALYDADPTVNRISNCENISYGYVVRNKHLIDWKKISAAIPTRKTDLVSIIICVHGRIELVEKCLNALFTHESGEKFEVIIVDNGSDLETTLTLKSFTLRYPLTKLIKNPENFYHALGHNIGFAASSGSKIVFLSSTTEVSPEWLRSLVRPLDNPAIFGTQPKLLNADGSINNVGIVFTDYHPTGYPIHSGQPGDFEPSQRSNNYSALTKACMAVRAESFAHVNGFDPIYINGLEDIDLCFRIGSGAPRFRYVADSIVIQHEDQQSETGNIAENNQKFFFKRWKRLLDSDKFARQQQHRLTAGNKSQIERQGSFPVNTGRSANFYIAANKQPASVGTPLKNSTIAIKISCPNSKIKDHWGDYHFAAALANAFLRKGISARIDFKESWESSAEKDDINLVLRGLSQFHPTNGNINLMWLISHPDKVLMQELDEFDHVFVASSIWADKLSASSDAHVEPLLQCTDPCRFHPDAFDQHLQSDVLFVANSRKVLRTAVRDAVQQEVEIAIYGEMWEGLAPSRWIKGEKIDNVDLPCYYASAGVVLNDHWDSMRECGFISNRIFDVLACGAPLVSDKVAGLPEELADGCHFFDPENRLRDIIQKVRRDPQKVTNEARKLADTVRRKHSFDARARRILQVVERIF